MDVLPFNLMSVQLFNHVSFLLRAMAGVERQMAGLVRQMAGLGLQLPPAARQLAPRVHPSGT